MLTTPGYPLPQSDSRHGPQRTPPALRPHRATTQRARDSPTDAPAPLNLPSRSGIDTPAYSHPHFTTPPPLHLSSTSLNLKHQHT